MVCENETELDDKIKELIEELNRIDKDYTLRDEDTGELIGSSYDSDQGKLPSME